MNLNGRQIRMARAAVDWSLRDLAAAAGVHHNTILHIERGRYMGEAATLNAIQKALEEAGVEFIDENGGGPGVRLRKSSAHSGSDQIEAGED